MTPNQIEWHYKKSGSDIIEVS